MAKKSQIQFIKENNFVKKTYELLTFNGKTLLLFSFIFMLISLFCVNAFLSTVKSICFGISGINYIAQNNIGTFLSNPYNIILLIVMYVFLAFVNIFNVSGLIFICRMSYLHKKTRLRNVISKSLNTCRRVLHPKNWIILLLVLLLLKFVGLLSAVNPSLQLFMPEFIEDFILANSTLNFLYKVLSIILMILSMVFIFALPIFVLSETSFINSVKKCKPLFRYFLTTLVVFTIAVIVFSAISVMISGAVSALATSIANALSDGISNMIVTHSGTVTQIIQTVFGFIIFPAVGMGIVTSLLMSYIDYFKVIDDIAFLNSYDKPIHKPSFAVLCFITVLLVIANVVLKTDDMYYAFNDSSRPQIAAHRGDSINCPENTMPAFTEALKTNPDWIELDVHQTSDGVIIVSHDDNIQRVSGIDTCVHENTYQDLMKLDVGSWFNEKFSYVRFSTLAEVLNKIKESNEITNVQIEIKPTEFDKNIEQGVLDVIEECNMTDRCVIISLTDTTLQKVKSLSPETISVYTMSLAMGAVDTIEWSDCFSIEASNINAYLVDRIHKAGKKCFAWTVNDASNVQHLVDCNVDCILTDNTHMLRSALDHADYNGGISKFVRMCLHD